MNTNELAGRYRARAVDSALGEASTGSEQVAIAFEIIEDGPAVGIQLTWYGYFSEKAFATTMKALRATGWKGTDLTDFDAFETAGLTAEVELVIEQEPDDQGGSRARVRWVNTPGSIAVKQRLDPLKAKNLAERMKGSVLAFDATSKVPTARASVRPAGDRAPAGPPHTDADAPPF